MKKHKTSLLKWLPALLVIALTIGFSEMLYQKMITSAKEKCWHEMFMAQGEVAREISGTLNANSQMLDLASDAIMMNADFSDEATILAYLATVREETVFDRIDVIFPNGTILVQSGARLEDNGEKTYEELIAKGSHVSQRVPDFLTGEESLHIFSPVYDEANTPIAILGATVHCSTLGALFSSAHYGEDALLFLVDRRDGKIVLDKRHDKPGSIYDMLKYQLSEGTDAQTVINDILSGKTNKLTYTSKAYKETSYTVYAPVENTDFTIVTVAQEGVVLADVRDMITDLTWIGAVEATLLLLFLLWIYFSGRKSSQIEKRAKEAELALLHKKEQELQSQYDLATQRQLFLENLAANLPGGYHRCTTDHLFGLTFISRSFTQVTGYDMAQLEAELGGSYMGIVAPEDRDYFLSLAPELEEKGFIHCSYRIRRRDGSIRWVKDTTQYVERDGEQYYQCALMDITEEIEAIEGAKQEAEANSRAKSTFLFNISHDIRTPMNAIKGFADMIADNPDDPAFVSETVHKIQQSSGTLMTLINDVLDLSRIERGKEELHPEPVYIRQLGRSVIEMFTGEMKDAGIQFIIESDITHTYVMCDPLKMARVCMNMLSNAKKFTPRGGSVVFGLEELHQNGNVVTYRLYARDTGVGMSPEFLKRAFDQFERERTSTESRVAGSGLGLAIIKNFVTLMGGTVELKSRQGQGTEISAVIPLTIVEEEAQALHDTSAKAVDMTGKRVLLVEDNEFNREIAKYILEGLHFIVEEAENGKACLEKVNLAPADYYDLILMDIQMPIMDGYTATAEIRRLQDMQKAGLPIVAMTANAFAEDVKKCLDTGMNGHIGKPIEADMLVRVLREILS